MANYDENGNWIKPKNFGKGRKRRNLQEKHIRYAMSQTQSNMQAAEFLNVCLNTYRSYARKYIDSESGKNLYELHKNQKGVGIKRKVVNMSTYTKRKNYTPMSELLEGKHPEYRLDAFKKRVFENKENIFLVECWKCGFDERRLTDNRPPLIIHFKDGDFTNYHKDNWEILCYNCFFLNVDTLPIPGRRGAVVKDRKKKLELRRKREELAKKRKEQEERDRKRDAGE
jgi:hypothetical protein